MERYLYYDHNFRVPNNLNDTSFFPELFTELTAPGNPEWQPDELKKLAGLNILRVLRDVEKVRRKIVMRTNVHNLFRKCKSMFARHLLSTLVPEYSSRIRISSLLRFQLDSVYTRFSVFYLG